MCFCPNKDASSVCLCLTWSDRIRLHSHIRIIAVFMSVCTFTKLKRYLLVIIVWNTWTEAADSYPERTGGSVQGQIVTSSDVTSLYLGPQKRVLYNFITSRLQLSRRRLHFSQFCVLWKFWVLKNAALISFPAMVAVKGTSFSLPLVQRSSWLGLGPDSIHPCLGLTIHVAFI
jgi:hypothetical protein